MEPFSFGFTTLVSGYGRKYSEEPAFRRSINGNLCTSKPKEGLALILNGTQFIWQDAMRAQTFIRFTDALFHSIEGHQAVSASPLRKNCTEIRATA